MATHRRAQAPRDANPGRDRGPGVWASGGLGPVILYVWLASLGTGAVTDGVFFLTESAYGYGRGLNLALGLASHTLYIPGALLIGPLLRRIAAHRRGFSARGAVTLITIVLGAVCLLPAAVAATDGSPGHPPAWTVWVVALVYAPMTGALWPIGEAFVTGGRQGRRLTKAVGAFNLSWASAMIAAYWLMAPIVEERPIDVLTWLGVVHLGTLAVLPRFAPEPGAHREGPREPDPVAGAALPVFRILLPASFIVMSTLTPVLSVSLGEMDIGPTWRPPLAGTWLVTRVAMFLVLHAWHGWYGRAWLAPVSMGALVVSFAGALLGPALGPGAGPIALVVVSLVVVGAAQAMIYKAALAYVMAAGDADVDAGGTHEALIGLGYTLGPLLGVLASQTAGGDGLWADLGVVSAVGGVTLAVSAVALLRRRRPGAMGRATP